jgi:hypothetical protein
MFKVIVGLLLFVSSSALASTVCSSANSSAHFDITGVIHDKSVQINFFDTGFNLQMISKSKNSLVLMFDGRKAYSLNVSPYRIYSQKSALSADIFSCQETAGVCEKLRVEIVAQLETALEKVDRNNKQAVNAIICALGIANSAK